MVYTLYMTSQNTYTSYVTCLYQRYGIPSKIIEHIYVRSIGFILIKILILYIYLLLFFVYKNRSDPAVGAASLALGLLRLVSVCLVSSVISWMPKQAAAHVQDLPMCVLAALSRIVPVGKALVRYIWLSESSGGSKQVQPSGPHERASA